MYEGKCPAIPDSCSCCPRMTPMVQQEFQLLRSSLFDHYVSSHSYYRKEEKEYLVRWKNYFMSLPSETIMLYYYDHSVAIKACQAALDQAIKEEQERKC